MKIKPLTNWRKNIMNLDPDQNGVLVYALAPDSPADDFNIEAGAIITEIDGNTVNDLNDFIKLAQKYQDDMPNIKFLQPRPTLDSIEDL
jgi:S1-C subfamily serine protease